MKTFQIHRISGRALSSLSASSRCRHGTHLSALGPVRTVLDESGMLAIKAWTCAACGDLVEEVRILSRPSVLAAVSTRYVVPVAAGRKQRVTATIPR
jgi:hypothetical protein